MGKVYLDEQILTDIADATRSKTGGSASMTPGQMADAIESIEQNVPTGNINITENGSGIDVAQYATASVNVQGGQDTRTIREILDGKKDEGYAQINASIDISQNGLRFYTDADKTYRVLYINNRAGTSFEEYYQLSYHTQKTSFSNKGAVIIQEGDDINFLWVTASGDTGTMGGNLTIHTLPFNSSNVHITNDVTKEYLQKTSTEGIVWNYQIYVINYNNKVYSKCNSFTIEGTSFNNLSWDDNIYVYLLDIDNQTFECLTSVSYSEWDQAQMEWGASSIDAYTSKPYLNSTAIVLSANGNPTYSDLKTLYDNLS